MAYLRRSSAEATILAVNGVKMLSNSKERKLINNSKNNSKNNLKLSVEIEHQNESEKQA